MCPAGFPYLFISLGVPFFDAFNTSRLARYLGHLAEAGGVLLNDDRDEANGSGTMPSGLAVDANVTWEQPRNLRSKETFWGWKGWLVLYTTHIGLYITSCCMSIFYTHIYIYIYTIYIYTVYINPAPNGGVFVRKSSKYMVDFPASHVWFQKDKQEATLETTFFSKTACPLTFARKGLRPQFTITMASNSWQDLLPSGNQTRLAGKSTNYTSCFLVSAHLWGVPSRLCLIILYDHEKSQILNYKVVYSPSQASILGISQPDT